MSEGFLGRWARRKQDVREGRAPDEHELNPNREVSAAHPATQVTSAQAAAVQTAVTQPHSSPDSAPVPNAGQQTAAQTPSESAQLPSLKDTLELTPQSDFKPFVARGVAPEVRNAAMKKLFADPHFNVMDGLDIYIDDYSIPSPLPVSMMRRMVGAQMLNLFDDEKKEQAAASGDQFAEPAAQQIGQKEPVSDPSSDAQLVANTEVETKSKAQTATQSNLSSPSSSQDNHADPDMRLQQDHAAKPQGPGRGTG